MPDHIAGIEGETITLTCDSDIAPLWSKEEGRINPNFGSFQNTLLLYEVREEDSGVYTCYGTKPNGEEFDASALVLIGGMTSTIT